MRKGTIALALAVSVGIFSRFAFGQEAAVAAPAPAPSGEVRDSGESASWMQQYLPEPWSAEIGVMFGMIFPSSDHNLHREERPRQEVNAAAPDFGLRGGYYPLPYLGVEVEAAMSPTSTEDGVGATVWTARTHAVGQWPVSRFVPFVVLGGGYLGLLSNPNGNDADELIHFGAGVRFGINDLMLVRLDFRDNLTQKNGAPLKTQTHHPEVLSGLSVRFYPHEEPPAAPPAEPIDPDHDGFVGMGDRCPEQSGVSPDGCPAVDGDQDGFPDNKDRCPKQKGAAPDGCPPMDRDEDGVLDPQDQCPDEAGAAPDGCPVKDADQDGIALPMDKCPDQAETRNGIEDDDGCPDELPAVVRRFTGVVAGVKFDQGKDKLSRKSRATLDEAVKVFKEYSQLRLRIVAHTDDKLEHGKSMELSKRQAEAVKAYLVENGIAADRLETHGAGPDQPLMSNETDAGRLSNRRIEFELIPPPPLPKPKPAGESVIETGF